MLIHGVLGAIHGKALLPVGVRLQGGALEVKAHGQGGVLSIDDILVCQSHRGGSLRDHIEVLALLGKGIGHAVIGERGLALGGCQHELSLDHAGKALALGCGIAEAAVLCDASILLGLELTAVEHLVLAIGADHAANKGKDKHNGQDHQTHHSQAVTEKALGHQGAGGQNLNTAVIVQREVLLGAALLLMVHFLLVRHESASFLKRYVRGGQPQRTECRKSGCRPESAQP